MRTKLSYGIIEALMQAFSRMRTLTGKIGFAILRSERDLQKEYQVYIDMRNNLIRKYADDGAEGIKPGDKNFPQFAQEYIELQNTEVEVDLHQVDKSDFDLDSIYCETAQVQDYNIVETYLVKGDDPNDTESGKGA